MNVQVDNIFTLGVLDEFLDKICLKIARNVENEKISVGEGGDVGLAMMI